MGNRVFRGCERPRYVTFPLDARELASAGGSRDYYISDNGLGHSHVGVTRRYTRLNTTFHLPMAESLQEVEARRRTLRSIQGVNGLSSIIRMNVSYSYSFRFQAENASAGQTVPYDVLCAIIEQRPFEDLKTMSLVSRDTNLICAKRLWASYTINVVDRQYGPVLTYLRERINFMATGELS